MNLLEIGSMAAGYGDVDIVSGIDLIVGQGEIVAICGTNGAGKSTITKAVMGVTPRCTGRISFAGTDLSDLKPQQRVHLGIGYVPQVANVFPSLTVMENLQVMEPVRDRKARCAEMLELFPALAERRRVKASALSGGERQQLAFARTLMTEPKLIILDEPTAALSAAITSQIFALIQKLPQLGAAVMIVEQRARQCLEISDRGYILDSGRIVLSGSAADLLANPAMAALYLGRGPEADRVHGREAIGAAANAG